MFEPASMEKGIMYHADINQRQVTEFAECKKETHVTKLPRHGTYLMAITMFRKRDRKDQRPTTKKDEIKSQMAIDLPKKAGRIMDSKGGPNIKKAPGINPGLNFYPIRPSSANEK